MNILGLNAYHADSSACLFKDGVLVAAAEEERFNRVKHWAGFPREAVRFCLRQGGLGIADLDMAAINSSPGASFMRKLAFTLAHRPDPRLVLQKIANRKKRSNIAKELDQVSAGETFKGRLIRVEHHLAHLASAFLVSPFQQAAVVSVDGFGDFASAAWGHGDQETLRIDGRVYFPHSLGIFYETVTHFLGFKKYGDEYKIMGLAAYGEPKYLNEMRRLVELRPDGTFRLGLRYFLHHKKQVTFRWENCEPEAGDYFTEEFISLLGPPRAPEDGLDGRHKNIAASAQAMYEEAFFHFLNAQFERYGHETLALSGGCGFNSLANGRIHLHTPFQKVYVQAAAGDAGGAIGAAAWAGARHSDGHPRPEMRHAYWGPEYSEAEISGAISAEREALEAAGSRVETLNEAQLIERTAKAIAAGQVVGWFQGRMEWGPRALGNRSILCDPRRADMKDILNRKIKRRESFRPFAPSVLRHAVRDWFETDDDVPFMMKVFKIKPARRSEIPAVTHVDGTGRLQTVTEDQNPRYFKLISAFEVATGVPMVLNTSFNENEPIVCTPAEALSCFLRTRMDVIVLGDTMISRGVAGD